MQRLHRGNLLRGLEHPALQLDRFETEFLHHGLRLRDDARRIERRRLSRRRPARRLRVGAKR